MHEGWRVQDKVGQDPWRKQHKVSLWRKCKKMRVCTLPGHILLNAVETGLRLISAVAGYVEGEDAQGRRLLRRRSWNLDALKWDKRNNGSVGGYKSEAAKMKLKWMVGNHGSKTFSPQQKTIKQYNNCTCVCFAISLAGLLLSPRVSSLTISAHSSFLIFQTAFCEWVEGIISSAEFMKRHSDAKCIEAKKKSRAQGEPEPLCNRYEFKMWLQKRQRHESWGRCYADIHRLQITRLQTATFLTQYFCSNEDG